MDSGHYWNKNPLGSCLGSSYFSNALLLGRYPTHKALGRGGISKITSPQPSTLRLFYVEYAPALGLYPTLPPPSPFLKHK
jgi:hypothetical protein